MNNDYRFVPLLLPYRVTESYGYWRSIGNEGCPNDLTSTDQGLTWFNLGDPFNNRLSLLLGRSGDDWIGTVLYAGLPSLIVQAGGTMKEGEYEWEVPLYNEPTRQSLHAMFFERIVGDIPNEDDCWIESQEDWPFPHSASNMVLERKTEEFIRKHRPEQVPTLEAGKLHLGNYDLYHDLMEFSGSQGYEITGFIGIVAKSMWRAEPEDLAEPTGF